jgi:hypothetical protein
MSAALIGLKNLDWLILVRKFGWIQFSAFAIDIHYNCFAYVEPHVALVFKFLNGIEKTLCSFIILGEGSNVVHEGDVIKVFRLIDTMADAEGFTRALLSLLAWEDLPSGGETPAPAPPDAPAPARGRAARVLARGSVGVGGAQTRQPAVGGADKCCHQVSFLFLSACAACFKRLLLLPGERGVKLLLPGQRRVERW